MKNKDHKLKKKEYNYLKMKVNWQFYYNLQLN